MTKEERAHSLENLAAATKIVNVTAEIKQRTLADQVRYYARKIESLATPDGGGEPDVELLGLAMAMRMTAKNIHDFETLVANHQCTK